MTIDMVGWLCHRGWLCLFGRGCGWDDGVFAFGNDTNGLSKVLVAYFSKQEMYFARTKLNNFLKIP